MSSYFPNRWPLSYLNLTKNMKTYIRRQQHKNIKHQDIKQKEPPQKYPLGTISNKKLLAGLNRFYTAVTSPSTISAFISRINFSLSLPEHEKVLITSGPGVLRHFYLMVKYFICNIWVAIFSTGCTKCIVMICLVPWFICTCSYIVGVKYMSINTSFPVLLA